MLAVTGCNIQRKRGNFVALLVASVFVTLILWEVQTFVPRCRTSNPAVISTVRYVTDSRARCRQRTPAYSGSQSTDSSNQDYLIPDDVVLDKLNDTMLTKIYWRYINTLQFLCRNQTRVGRIKDGGKEICVDEKYRPRQPCLVYSFGSNFDFSFEKGMSERYGCELHTFDPSMAIMAIQAPSYTKFQAIGLANKDYRNIRRNFQMRKLSTIIANLHHKKRTIDVLKMDIEGGEWSVLPEIFQSGELQRVRQLCIEIHFGRVYPNTPNSTTWGKAKLATQLKVLRRLYNEGFRIFMRDHNTYRVQYFQKPFREITNINEISLVNLKLEYGTKDFDYNRTFGDKASKFEI